MSAFLYRLCFLLHYFVLEFAGRSRLWLSRDRSFLFVVMNRSFEVGGKLSKQVARNPDPGLRGNALIALNDGIRTVRLPQGRQRRPPKRSCVEKHLRPQGFFIAPVGHEVADDSVLDALANARAISAEIIPGSQPAIASPMAVNEFCIRNCA